MKLDGLPCILRGLQPSEDRVAIGEWGRKLDRLKEVVTTMGRILAWDQLRASGRSGAANADRLSAFARFGYRHVAIRGRRRRRFAPSARWRECERGRATGIYLLREPDADQCSGAGCRLWPAAGHGHHTGRLLARTATATSSQYGPAFFTYPENQAVATRLDGSLAVANGTFPGFPTVAAKPGDVLILWGTGFGPATPSIPVGFATPSSQFLTGPVTVTLGSTSVPVSQGVAFLSPGSAGLYQLVITVPSNMANGNYPIVATINGISSPSTEILTVQQ